MKRILIAAAVLTALVTEGASHFNGGRVVPVHRLAPVDCEGAKISFAEAHPAAISQVKTCGQCHDVGKMVGGSHFRAPSCTNNVARLCNFEPWFKANKDGTLTSFTCPKDAGMTMWEFTKEFGRAFPGGGIGADAASLAEAGGDRSRWFVTGPLEVNCLACHQQGSGYDPSEWAKQVLRENFAGAALAAAGLATVEGMNARLEGSWDAAFIRENRDDHLFKVPEKIAYDVAAFDAKGRCVFKVGKPQNERCLACHATAEATAGHRDVTTDVHLKRGMKCIDCHTSGMSHRIETKSCTACHIDKGGEGPKPTHAGIPLVHFKKLACTVCHAGVTKEGRVAQVRTARANRIGIYGKAQWATDVPWIVEPVFAKTVRGVIEPCRAAWTKEGAEPVLWPFAHDIRPARQARGAAPVKCAACHTADSEFFFGKITPVYPTKDGFKKGAPICQSEFLKTDGIYHRVFGFTFFFRPGLKVFMWTIFGFLCLFAAAAAAVALKKLSQEISERTDHFLWGAFKWLTDVGMVLSIVYLAVSGVVGWVMGDMGWWFLMGHMVAGGAFVTSVILLAFFRTHERTEKACTGILWMLWITLAAGTVFTAVMPMMTVFGAHGQEILLWAHRCTSLTFTLVSVLLCGKLLKK